MWYNSLLERNLLPDFLIRIGIRRICAKRLAEEHDDDLEKQHEKFMRFVNQLRQSPIAVETNAANQQHYYMNCPPNFFNAYWVSI